MLRKICNFFRKLAAGIIGFYCLLLDVLLALIYAQPYGQMGGLALPGFVAFLMWAGLVLILWKGSPIASVVVGAALYLVIYPLRFGVDEYYTQIATVLALAGIGYYLIKTHFFSGNSAKSSGGTRGGGSMSRTKYTEEEDEEEEEYGGSGRRSDEDSKRAGKRPNTFCCEYLRQYELGYYDNYMSCKCTLIDSQMTMDDARRRCFYSDDFMKCPQYMRAKGIKEETVHPGGSEGMGVSPSPYCCFFLKEYPSGYYNSYSHRCEATGEEIPYDNARANCYDSNGYKQCPIWQKNR